MTKGVRKGLQAVANPRGVIAGLAMDPRSALRKLLTEAELEDCRSHEPGEHCERERLSGGRDSMVFRGFRSRSAERAQERVI